MRRNQRRVAELNSTIRKLEDRNALLVDERNELVCQIFIIKLFCEHGSKAVTEKKWVISAVLFFYPSFSAKASAGSRKTM